MARKEYLRSAMERIREPYPKNPNHPEHLKHRTSTGEFTRSKSEVLIYEKLKLYESIGIGPWDNLILTFDVGDGMIDMREIEKMIQIKLLL